LKLVDRMIVHSAARTVGALLARFLLRFLSRVIANADAVAIHDEPGSAVIYDANAGIIFSKIGERDHSVLSFGVLRVLRRMRFLPSFESLP
jgi:hypothetical protein